MHKLIHVLLTVPAALSIVAASGCGARTGPQVADVDRIAYVSDLGQSDSRPIIRYVRTDVAASPRDVTAPPTAAGWPAWGPGGASLAFSAWEAGRIEIRSLGVSVGGVLSPQHVVHRNLDSNNLLDKRMSWGANGLIAFQESGAIFTVPATATPFSTAPAIRLTAPGLVAAHPSWCADGQLAFDATDATGTNVVLLSRDFRSTTTVATGSEPSCSDHLFAVVFTRGGSVFFHDYQTGAERLVTTDASQPAFGPGSTQVAFVRGGQIWVCDVNGDNAHPVTGGPADREPAWGRVPGEN